MNRNPGSSLPPLTDEKRSSESVPLETVESDPISIASEAPTPRGVVFSRLATSQSLNLNCNEVDILV